MLRLLLAAAFIGVAIADAADPKFHAAAQDAFRQPLFGVYSQAYLDRQQLKRWKDLCKGGGVYQARSEAYEAKKPDPCTGAKQWLR